MNATGLPPLIQWHEGMLLSPQHFQQLSLRGDELLHYHNSLIAPFHYGVRHLRIDSALLFEGILRVLELEAVMPDGLVISFRPDTEQDLLIDLRPFVEAARQRPLLIRLAVSSDKHAGARAEGELARYASSFSEPLPDENTGDEAMQIPILRPRLRLLCAEVPPPRYCHMPLLQVRHRNESFALTDYIPPLLQVAQESPLGELCLHAQRRVRDKAMYLLETVRSPAITTKPEVVEERKRLIHYLMSGTVPFEVLLRCGVCHPFPLYVSLCSVAAHVAAMGVNIVPPVFQRYDHDDLRRTFREVTDFILASVDEGVSESFLAFPLHYDAGVFGIKFESEWMGAPLVLGVKPAPGMPDAQLVEYMNSALIATGQRFRLVRDRRILGANRTPIDRYEGLLATRGQHLYELEADPEFVVPEDLFMIGNVEKPNLPRPAEIILYVGIGPDRPRSSGR